MEEVTITKENCEGYVELYRYYYKLTFPIEYYMKNLCLGLGILTISTIIWLYLPIPMSCPYIIIGGMVSVVVMCSFKKANRKLLKEIKKQYPFLNYQITKEELKQLLEKENILIQDGTVLDIKGYLKKIETEKELIKYNEVKDNYIRETRFENIEASLMVPEEELEKSKQKIKKLTK